MTIRELAAGNPMIMDIDIDIRENGKLKHIYSVVVQNIIIQIRICLNASRSTMIRRTLKSMSRSIIRRSTLTIWSR